MILTILGAVVAVIGVVFGVNAYRFKKKFDALDTVGCTLFIGGLIVVLLGMAFGIGHTINYELNRKDAIEQREIIVYRLEQQTNSDAHSGDIVVNGGAYEDARKFNQTVRYQNKWGTNLWFNWFVGWDYVGLEEIDILGTK